LGADGRRRHGARRGDARAPGHTWLSALIYNLSARRLNDYIAEFVGEEFTAKDFRTWGGTLVAAVALAERPPAETATEGKRTVAAVMRTVGERLGNTPAVARALPTSVLPSSSSIWTGERSMISGRAICASSGRARGV